MKSQKLNITPKNNSQIAVKKLIAKLKIMYYNQNPMLKGIENFQNLYSALCDLDDIIGMYDIKKSIVDQIKFLLVNYTGEKSKFEGSMLNTMLCGNPGTGKTSIGICLSNIWNALGLLKKEKSSDFETNRPRNTTSVKISEPKKENESIKTKIDDVFLIDSIKLMLEREKKTKHVTDKSQHNKHPNSIETPESNLGDLLRHIKYTDAGIINIQKKLNIQKINSFKKLERVNFNDDSIKIVSRVDLVAGYVGQSSLKTRAVLMEALKTGKVLFIDEAYSIVLDEKDPFGLEVLTEINRFMSEHPSLVCIFAGYKEKMETTIFKAQPGLKRRLTWVFEIKKYTGDMLTSIFLKQLEKDDWKYQGDTKLLDKFFTENIDHFSAFGGDTLTMCFYVKLVYSELKFDFESCVSLEDKTVTYDIFINAYENMYCLTRPKPEINMSYRSMFC